MEKLLPIATEVWTLEKSPVAPAANAAAFTTRQGVCAFPGHAVDLEGAECLPHQMGLVMERTVSQICLGLGTCSSAHLHIQKIVHSSHELLTSSHHLYGAAVVRIVAALVVLAHSEVQRSPHAFLIGICLLRGSQHSRALFWGRRPGHGQDGQQEQQGAQRAGHGWLGQRDKAPTRL